jgi:uncharacterized lipoprotein YddW (UPF0748 family)
MWLVASLALLICVAASAQSPDALLTPQNVRLESTAEWRQSASRQSLALPARASGQLALGRPLSTSEGTMIAWIEPLWHRHDQESHVFFTLSWQGDQAGYMALSQGWWEPAGARKLYFVLSNQDQAFCHIPGEFDYTLFIQSQRTMIAATWSKHNDVSIVRLYVDGNKVCERQLPSVRNRMSTLTAHVGSDLGATDRRNRKSDFIIHELAFLPSALTDQHVFGLYRTQEPSKRTKWLSSLVSDVATQKVPGEMRVLFDEDRHWVDSPLEIQRTIRRVKAAGFNVYIPCVWDGAGAAFESSIAPVDPRYRRVRTAHYDPLQYLIEFAKNEGVAVHLWFHVARRGTPKSLPEFAVGAPSGAFNVHDVGFRRFIVEVITEAVTHYPADGVNLDYIRSMGVCQSSACRDEYHADSRRDLLRDIEAVKGGAAVPSIASWNAKAVSAIVRDAARRIKTIAPATRITVATLLQDREREHQGVEAEKWIADGSIDAAFHMAYETPLDIARIDSIWRQLPSGRLGVLLRNYDHIGNKVYSQTGETVVDGLRLARERWPGSLFGIYHYPHLSNEQIKSLENEARDVGRGR